MQNSTVAKSVQTTAIFTINHASTVVLAVSKVINQGLKMLRSFVLARREAKGKRPCGMNVFGWSDGRGMMANQKTG